MSHNEVVRRVVYSWVAAGGPCMWPECASKAQHVHHIQPRKFRGGSYDENLIALCIPHHGAPHSEIHLRWEDWEQRLRDYRVAAVAAGFVRVETKTRESKIAELEEQLAHLLSRPYRARKGAWSSESHIKLVRTRIKNLKSQEAPR